VEAKTKKKTPAKAAKNKEFPGLYQKRGWWYYQPSMKELAKGAPRPKAQALGTDDYPTAVAKAERIRVEKFAGTGKRPISVFGRMALDDRLASGIQRDQTNKRNHQMLNKMVEFFGDVGAHTLEASDFERWYQSIMRDRAPATAYRHLVLARSVYAWMLQRNLVQENPAALFRPPVPRPSKREKFCTAEQRDLLLETVEREDLKYFLMVGFHAGLRAKEIIESKPSWFTFHKDRAWIDIQNDDEFTTKSGKPRRVPLRRQLREFLEEYGMREPFMLRPDVDRGKADYRWDPRRPWQIHTKANDLEWVTPHTMRHTFASLLVMDGVSETKIIRWMGITRPVFDHHYAGLSPYDDDIEEC